MDGDGGRQRDPLRGVREHPLREPRHLHAQPEEPGRKVDLPREARVQVLVPAAHGHPVHPGRQQVRPSRVQEQGGASDTRLELFLHHLVVFLLFVFNTLITSLQSRRESRGGVLPSQPLSPRGSLLSQVVLDCDDGGNDDADDDADDDDDDNAGRG